jgi:hypothetical protein
VSFSLIGMEKAEGMEVVSEESAGDELLIPRGRRSPEYASIDVLEEVALYHDKRKYFLAFRAVP